MIPSQPIPWPRYALLSFAVGALLVSHQSLAQEAQGFMALQPEQLKWSERDGLPQAVVAGDPSKPGIYVIRVRFAPGRHSDPHFHDQDRYVTVIKGTWWAAVAPDGDVYDPSKMVPMKAGSFVKHPAFGHHYDGAKDEETIVQIIGMGPVTTTRLNP